MNPTALLLATFLLSIVGLFGFIWSLRKGLFDAESSGARTIFSPGEIGRPEEPSASADQHHALTRVVAVHAGEVAGPAPTELAAREAADRSSSFPAFMLIACATVWLVVASAAGLLSSLKLHWPDLLTIRPGSASAGCARCTSMPWPTAGRRWACWAWRSGCCRACSRRSCRAAGW